ncbi:MAG TPA: TIR domain-containing protein [Thermoanaerobaculia bacterium]|nr:TIR domain-containing protein [Thermoanaerobaculia bacterium]
MREHGSSDVLFIDDDPYGSSSYVLMLEAHGFDVHYVHDVDTAIVEATERAYVAVIIDIMMPTGTFFDQLETAGGYRTGVALAKEMADLQPSAVLLALTNSRDADVEAWFTLRSQFGYYFKGDVHPEEFATIVANKVAGVEEMPKIFIVHGHDRESLLSLKNYLQNTLGLPEPMVLSEQPSRGLTLIEKFEHYADDCDVVFALFTPDDFKEVNSVTGRPRQNVVFEYGYFIGRLGRRSGRVFLLYKQGADIPSDLKGVVYVDVTNGVEAAGEQIRRELRGLFDGLPVP